MVVTDSKERLWVEGQGRSEIGDARDFRLQVGISNLKLSSQSSTQHITSSKHSSPSTASSIQSSTQRTPSSISSAQSTTYGLTAYLPCGRVAHSTSPSLQHMPHVLLGLQHMEHNFQHFSSQSTEFQQIPHQSSLSSKRSLSFTASRIQSQAVCSNSVKQNQSNSLKRAGEWPRP